MKRTIIVGLGLGISVIAPGCAGAIVDEPPAPGSGGQGATGDGDGDGGDGGDGDAPTYAAGGMQFVITGGGSSGGSASGGANTGGSGGGLQQLPNCSAEMPCDDGSTCTNDACVEGFCEFSDNGTCECQPVTAAVDCNDDNDCTDDACMNNECQHTARTGTCEDDGNACTADMCTGTECTHADSGLCGENTIVLRSMRDAEAGQWISLQGTQLVWDVTTSLGGAELFNRVEVDTTTFRLQAVSTGMYVTLDANDDLAATADQGAGAIFTTTDCGTGIGLDVTTDDDGGSFIAAEPGGELRARSTGCNSDGANAWERLEIISATG